MRFSAMTAAVMCFCMLGTGVADVVNVPGDQPTIQAGLDAANPGDTVLVADGTYSGPGNVDVTLTTTGITLTSANGPSFTVIDCQGAAPAITVSGSTDTTTIIDGLAFTGGVGDNEVPGGVFVLGGAAKIRDCVFHDNESQKGGAVKVWSAAAVVHGCEFTDNVSTWNGGAVSAYWSNLWIRECVFTGNSSVDDGGAIYVDSGGDISIQRCSIVDNAGTPSGGIGLHSIARTDVVVDACIIALSSVGLAIDDEFTLTDVYQCCVFGNAGGDGLPDGASENIFVDPKVCDYQNSDVSLCANSPCLPGSGENPWGVLIGALGQGCAACDSPVAPLSWGGLKWLYRSIE